MKHQDQNNSSPSTATKITLVLVIACVLVFGFSKDGEEEEHDKVENNVANELTRSLPSPPLHKQRQFQPPPMWGQMETSMLRSGVMTAIPILMLITTRDNSIIRRSIENILHATSGSGMHLIVSVQDPSGETMDLLQRYPLKIHLISKGTFDDGVEGVKHHHKGVLGRFLRVPALLENFKNLIGVLKDDNDVCVSDSIFPTINILNTRVNSTSTTTYHLTLEEMRQVEKVGPFGDHPYNPIYRKSIINSRNENIGNKSPSSDEQSTLAANEKENGGRSLCQKSKAFKEAINFALRNFPQLQHLVLMESGFIPSSDFLRFFEQTLPILKEDSSLFCISTHNPLASLQTSSDPSKLYRVDHFVRRGTLIPRKLVEEIGKDFVIYETSSGSMHSNSALESLETWLSWWSRRRRRGCVVPSVPRICPMIQLAGSAKEDTDDVKCSPETMSANVNATRLLHYQYSQDLYWKVKDAEPLGTNIKDCRNPRFFPEIMNTSGHYIIYIKMENYDDDFTFHHVMKCFGLDLPSTAGYFEGIFQLTFRQANILIMGIPYSRFSPALKDTKALILAAIKGLPLKGVMQFHKHRQSDFTFTTLPVYQIVV